MAFLTKAIRHLRSALGLDALFHARTLTGALSLSLLDGTIQLLDPAGASRAVALPAVSVVDNGRIFVVYNTADADGELLSVSTPAASLLATVDRGQLAFFRVSAGAWVAVGPKLGAAPSALITSRYALRWTAGQRGKPGVNGDILSATEATREIADPDFELLGTNAVSGSSAFAAEGGIRLTTAGASADQVILAPHLDANQSAWTQVTWGTDKATEWECRIVTGASIADAIIWAGLKLTNTPVVATDNDQAFFRYEAGVNDGEWQAVSSIGGTDTAADTGVVVAVSTAYHLRIAIDAARIARFYVNGVLVATTTALTNAVDLIPYIGVQSAAVAAKVLDVQGQAISRNAG